MKRTYIFLLCLLLVSACCSHKQPAKEGVELDLSDSIEVLLVRDSLASLEAQSVVPAAPAVDSVALALALASAVAKKESAFLGMLKEYVSQSTLNVRKKPKAPVRQNVYPIYEDDYYGLEDWEYCDYPFPLYGRVSSVSGEDVYMSFNVRGDLDYTSIATGDSTDPQAEIYKYNANNVLVGIYFYLYRPYIDPGPAEAPSMVVKKFDSRGRVIEKDCYTGGVIWCNKCATIKTKYRANGRIVEDVEFDCEGNKAGKTISKYDSGGRLIEVEKYDHTDSLLSKLTKKYDKKGRVIEDSIYGDGTSTYTCKYDKRGNRVEIANYVADSLVSKRLLYYSLNGILALTESYDGKDSLESATIYSYDRWGNMIEKRIYNAAGELQRKFSFKYDRMGNVIEAIVPWSYSEYNEETVYKYKITYYK